MLARLLLALAGCAFVIAFWFWIFGLLDAMLRPALAFIN